MKSKRSLGRGLSELLSMSSNVAPSPKSDESRHLPIEFLQPGKYQPRKDMNSAALQELADSIRAQGILQPLLVRNLGTDRYEIIAGERRWRAAQLAGLTEVPVFLRAITDETAMAMGLIENIQREDLNAIEQAVALHRLGEEFQLTHDEIATAIGKSRATVSNMLRLLQLESRARALLEQGAIDMGHARALLSLEKEQQWLLAQQIVAKTLSVRETEALVQRWQSQSPTPIRTATKISPDVLRLESELSDKLGAGVKIQHAPKGHGKLLIRYHSLEELDGILARIR